MKNDNVASFWIVPPVSKSVYNNELTIVEAWLHTDALDANTCSDKVDCQEKDYSNQRGLK
jgi:hypothetical protein